MTERIEIGVVGEVSARKLVLVSLVLSSFVVHCLIVVVNRAIKLLDNITRSTPECA